MEKDGEVWRRMEPCNHNMTARLQCDVAVQILSNFCQILARNSIPVFSLRSHVFLLCQWPAVIGSIFPTLARAMPVPAIAALLSTLSERK
jgi:hypothetical protein